MDRKLLEAVVHRFDGGPVGLDNVAASIGEEPGKGDDTRSWPPFVGGEATYFMSVNRDKKSLTLNLKAPAAIKVFTDLVKMSDVVLENFRPGTMEKLGLGYATLAKLNRKLIYCAVSGYGRDGPYGD